MTLKSTHFNFLQALTCFISYHWEQQADLYIFLQVVSKSRDRRVLGRIGCISFLEDLLFSFCLYFQLTPWFWQANLILTPGGMGELALGC